MIAPDFLTFQKFNDKTSAMQLADLLDKNNIEYKFEDASSPLDASFGGGELTQEYLVKLQRADFEKADELLLHESVNDIHSIDKDYYLFTFSDDELLDVVVKKDEWNPFDYLLAQKLLKERGKEISTDTLKSLRDERLNELAKPEPHQTASIIAGYIMALLGGVFGIFIGWYLKTHKKTLPNGESVYSYPQSDRNHGSIIMALGIAMLIVITIAKIFWAAIKSITC